MACLTFYAANDAGKVAIGWTAQGEVVWEWYAYAKSDAFPFDSEQAVMDWAERHRIAARPVTLGGGCSC